jgi:NADH-quinone oxidoreductase subunit M
MNCLFDFTDMIVFLLFLIPLISGIIAFLLKGRNQARSWALLASLATLAVTIWGSRLPEASADLSYSAQWMGTLGSSFSLRMDGMGKILCLLTAIAFPIIILATWKSEYKRPHAFFGLMLLAQAGLMGVFTSFDALLFYFFWELALIPVYFLASGWGGEKRIAVTFKFFIYTFTASVIMLIGLLYLYFQTPGRSFSLEAFYALDLPLNQQNLAFWLLFVAFAVKMPVFPFHTWQPDTYEQSSSAVTMVLSGIMVKMGLYGLIRWVLPVVPLAAFQWGNVTMSLGVIGVIYASIIALRQDDMKRLIAYSSIAHMGLMAMAVFAESKSSMQGVMIQMFNHGINIIGLWIVVELIERQMGTRRLSQLGGLAQRAPALAILLVIVALANVALPLTNAFVGEFLMLNGIWNSEMAEYTKLFTALAGLGIILSAAYTLRMIQKIFFGPVNDLTSKMHDIRLNEKLSLLFIVLMIVGVGIYPQPLLNMTDGFVNTVLKEANISHLLQ